MSDGAARVEVLLADHDPLARRAIRDSLSAHAFLHVVGEASTAAELEAALEQLHPDVVLLDPEVVPGGGAAAIGRLRSLAPSARVVVFAVREDRQAALEALQAGAEGYLTKDVDMESLARSLQGLSRGEAAISRRMAGQVLARLRAVAEQVRRMRPVRGPLSSRQWQVLDLLADGYSQDEIARILELSPDTIRTHTRGLLRRLRVGSVSEAICEAKRLRAGEETGET